MMSTLIRKLVALVTLSLGILYPQTAWSDCVDCSVGKDPSKQFNNNGGSLLSDIGMERINCTSAYGLNFEQNFCLTYLNVKDHEDFKSWINKCKDQDPKKRKTMLDFYSSITCEADNMSITDRLDGKKDFNTYEIPMGSFLIWDKVAGVEVVDYYKKLLRYYRDISKDNNFKEMREFAAIMNRPDANGYSFLDHVALKWNDDYCEDIGLNFQNVREALIRNMCVVGMKFNQKDHQSKYQGICKSNPKYAGS